MDRQPEKTRGFDTPLGRLSLWLHHRDHKWRLTGDPPLEVDTDPAKTLSVSEALLASGFLDFELLAEDAEAVQALASQNHFYLYVGPPFEDGRRYPWCNRLRLQRRHVRGQLLWRVEEQDARKFVNERWRHARTWVLLATKRGQPVRLRRGEALQWPLDLGYKQEWVRDTFAGVLHDLLSLTVPTQEQDKGFIRKVDLQAALTEVLDVNLVMWAYYVSQELATFAELLERFLRRSGFRGGLQQALRRLTPHEAQPYWARQAYQQPTQILQAVRCGETILPTAFVVTEQQPIDGEVRVALAAARSALALARRLMAQLRAPIEHGLVASYGSEETKQFIEVPLAALERHSRHIQHQLRKVGVEAAVAATADVNLPQIQTANPLLETLRKQASRLDHRANLAEQGLTLSLALEATNKVYEEWCFLRIVGALFELGFSVVDRPDLNHGPLPLRLAPLYPSSARDSLRLHHERFAGSITLRRDHLYDMSHENAEALYGAETRYEYGFTPTTSQKNKPDFALEFCRPDQKVPDLVVFDATALTAKRQDKLREKFWYYDTLRAFQEQDEVTGESRRIVRAAWALYPGTEGEKAPYQLEMPKASMSSVKWRWGTYSLNARPENLNHLPSWLDDLLTEVGLLQPA